MAWKTRCECGYESEESYERHFDAIEDIVDHLMRSSRGCSTVETEILKADDSTNDD